MTLKTRLSNKNIKFTPEGGLAVRMLNKAGAASSKGQVVEPSSDVDNAVKLTTDGDVDPVGVFYDTGVADGSYVWVVIAGIADVKYGTAVTRATFARVPVSADSVSAGDAIAEALPSSPFATDKHFQEIGHPIETIAAPGLAKTILHFN